MTDLIESLGRLPAERQAEHLALLGASDVAELRSRLQPRVTLSEEDSGWRVLVQHTSLDGRNRLTLELSSDGGNSSATLADDHVSIRTSDLGNVELEVTVTTDSEALTPLGYGASSDIQLWNVTDLAVQFLMDRLPPQ